MYRSTRHIRPSVWRLWFRTPLYESWSHPPGQSPEYRRTAHRQFVWTRTGRQFPVSRMKTFHAPPKLTISVAGEACPAELVERWAAGRQFFNLYGPTEATIWTTMAQCRKSGRGASGNIKPTIGKPIANNQVYILDRHLQPTPLGVPGEI